MTGVQTCALPIFDKALVERMDESISNGALSGSDVPPSGSAQSARANKRSEDSVRVRPSRASAETTTGRRTGFNRNLSAPDSTQPGGEAIEATDIDPRHLDAVLRFLSGG